MTDDQMDDRLWDLYRESKSRDVRRIPAFSGLARPVLRPVVAHRAPAWSRLAAAAVVLAVGATAAIVTLEHRRSTGEFSAWAALTNWEATTDVLLSGVTTPWSGQDSTVGIGEGMFESGTVQMKGAETL